MTEPPIDKVLRHVACAIYEANHRRVSVHVRRALQEVLKEIWAQKDRQRKRK